MLDIHVFLTKSRKWFMSGGVSQELIVRGVMAFFIAHILWQNDKKIDCVSKCEEGLLRVGYAIILWRVNMSNWVHIACNSQKSLDRRAIGGWQIVYFILLLFSFGPNYDSGQPLY